MNNANLSLADLRTDYKRAALDERDILRDPFVQFRQWFDAAVAADVPDPNRMRVATGDADGRRAALIGLRKDADAQGFTFFFGNFLDQGDASLTRSFFMWHPWLYIVLAPAVGMKLWSEEHRLGTLELLMTMPIAPWQSILGKFLAAAVVWATAS